MLRPVLDSSHICVYIGGLPSPSVDPFRFDTGRSACVEALCSSTESLRKDTGVGRLAHSLKTKVASPTGRISFAKIAEPLEVPDLLDLQIDSFDWLIGNDAWRDRVKTALDQGRTDINTKSGLEEIFEEISPIEDFSGTMSLSFRDHRFEPPKNTVDECKERDVTYAAPLFVTAEFMNNETGEIKSQTVFMGDFP